MYAINQIVSVNSFYFPKGAALRAFPQSMEFGGVHCTFTDGLQYLVSKGKQVIKLFDMTDGRLTYRLRFEDGQWTLISTRSLA